MKNKSKKLLKIWKFVFFLIILFLITYNLYIMYQNIEIYGNSDYEAKRTTTNLEYEETKNIEEEKIDIPKMLDDVTKSVVGISKLTSVGGSIFNNITSDELGLGTGIIVSENGYILSNSHVTGDKYSTCYVTIDENKYKGTVIWSESDLDLSILKVPANNLKYVTLGNSSNLNVGETVYAIGNPIGYEFRRTVTSGIISALNRTIKIDENDGESYVSDLIQTDATINPGNSGGPLINRLGQVIGINTVKITSAEGIGFAIPINVIKPVVESFKENGNFEEATLGIYAYDSDVAKYLNLKNSKSKGIYISKVLANSSASNSNLKEGDLIISIDGKKINTINDLRAYIYTKKPEDMVILDLIRGEKKFTVDVMLSRK